MIEEELLKKAKNGDNNAINDLMVEYKPLVIGIARKYFLVNSTPEDLIQEGMLGLFKAFLNYRKDEHANFKTFATICINRQIQSAIIKNNRNKNLPLNTYFSIDNQGKILLNVSQGKGEDDDRGFFLSAKSLNPEESMLFKENVKEINERVNKVLSGYEKEILKMYISGLNYIEIANKLNKSSKSVDNALSRIKIKLRGLKCI